jgi:hypothetical protein
MGTTGMLRVTDSYRLARGSSWQCFHLRPDPQGHGSLRPRRESAAAYRRVSSEGARPARSSSHLASMAGRMWPKNAL